MHSPSRSENGEKEDSASFHGFEEAGAVAVAMDPVTEKEYRVVCRQRSQVKQKLVRIQRTLITSAAIGLAQLNVLSKTLSAVYTEYSGFHSKVLSLVSDEDLFQEENEYDAFEDIYNNVSNAVEELLLEAKNRAVPTSAPNPSSQQVIFQQQALKMPIPTFSGSYAEWPKFKAIFTDLMANSGDTDAIKLYHLDKALIGNAAGVLDAKILSEGNYQQAWNVLMDRYDNKRAIVESHFRGLLTLKKMSSTANKELRALVDEAVNHIESLRYLQQEINGTAEHFFVFLIVSALDKSARQAWEATQKKGELPNYQQTIDFLKSRCQVLENCEAAGQPAPSNPKPHPPHRSVPQRSHAASTGPSQPPVSCEICGGPHRNVQCSALSSLTPAQKNEKIRAAGVCFNCLRKGHRSKDCPSDKTCHKCQRRHHTLLHENEEPSRGTKPNVSLPTETMATPPPIPAATTSQMPAPVNQPVSTTCSANFAQSTKTVLLLTAVVQVYGRRNQPHPCRVLLDSGSQVNFITEEMANRLGIPKKPANIPIVGINALRTHAHDKVTIKFRSRVSTFHASLECLVTPRVTGTIPTSKIDIAHWMIPEELVLADPKFHIPDKVDLLIGGELFFDLLKPGHLSLADGLPQLRDTQLGWIIAGVIIGPPHASNVSPMYVHASVADIERNMQQFWQIEEVPDVPNLSTEEIVCEAHFLSTYQRDESGRFMVQLPFNSDLPLLDDCRALALKRFLMLEKRLVRNPELRIQYVDFIQEYEALGHCRAIMESEDPPNQQSYYLPHHAVLRPSSSSTKCRVVFDASAKSSPSHLSLNEVLHVGPVVQNDLHHIMLRFRKFKVAFTGDICKMYRQVVEAPSDRRFLRIFWREQPSLPLRVLELCTVTYGTASAPYQATRCLVQLVKEDGENFPIAARIVKEETYMDDVLSGADSVEDAIVAKQQLKELLSRGGFPIRKWCSNSQQLMENIPIDERETMTPGEQGVNETIKVLGLRWDPTADTLKIAYHPNPPVKQPPTKRTVYSEIAKFFDPLGLVSPVIVLAKLLAQKLWQLKINWDDPVDENIAKQWQNLQLSLMYLHDIEIPRCVVLDNAVAYELHGFSDASTAAYGACIYLRSLFADGSAKLRLLTSKSKLAPLSELTIPRKELCAALLLTRLLAKVLPALNMPVQEVVLWSDSTIVLAWLKKPLNQLQLFVRNRVAVIQQHTDNFRWEHVRSHQNPADVISRGQLPEDLATNTLRWHGPSYLEVVCYEVVIPDEIPEEALPELKAAVAISDVRMDMPLFFSNYSNFRKLQRIVGYIRRFANNCRKQNPTDRELRPHLTVHELRRATESIIHVIQHAHFADEIKRVLDNEPCKRLGNLRPIYTNGLLRVGGRLDRSQLPFESRHQIILPDKDPVIHRFIQQMHVELLHVGQTGLLNALRQSAVAVSTQPARL
ncbi:uncharacterized protein LOC128744228 [Sabethes cyaneus]|uniref:uncharacterized protein LOC128744228 n=1 Tax=Sabethes cyaneus TaxID=53552 RepID=UPI00237E3DE4|nr:uncharacterized protein LOC128744228 [Sabethes cyaneus]